MKKIVTKAIAVLMTLVLLIGVVPANAIFTKDIFDPPVKIGVISDPHYFPESYVNNDSAVYLHEAYCDSKLMGESAAILKAALQTISERQRKGLYNMDYLILPGDLTSEGEKLGHMEVASLLKAFEAQTGIDVYIINGNHDINNYAAVNYNGPGGKRISARDNPDLLLTTPEMFKEIYADFGYNQADSVFIPANGKAGGLSYSIGLRGGYRFIAIDSCVYSADVTGSGNDSKESSMNITPELAQWVINETKEAVKNGETVIATAHGSLVEHFDLEKFLSKTSTIYDNERLAGQFADAGMHFIFTGHMHANDVASFVSANNETIYDIETCALISYPNTYREASFSKGPVQGYVSCDLNNVDCDAESPIDVSNISDKYGIIEKPFSENYCMPMLYGGSIEQGIHSDAVNYFNNAFLFRVSDAMRKYLPGGLAGLLAEKGLDLGSTLTKSAPGLTRALTDFNLTPEAFSQFLGAVVERIDNKYIFDTTHTLNLVSATVARFAEFEIAAGNSSTEFGKIALLALTYNAAGNENPTDNPEITQAISALRTQAGADRLIAELLDIVINDILFDDVLPSISLNELDAMLPSEIMLKLRAIAGDDVSVGGILDLLFNTTAKRLNKLPFVHIASGRDLVMASFYTLGLPIINAKGRLDICNALANVLESFTSDINPFRLGDNNCTLEYNGKVVVTPTTENYRLPADIVIKGSNIPGDIFIEWHTMLGIDGSDVQLTPSISGFAFEQTIERIDKPSPAVDLGFMTLDKTIPLIQHTVAVSGLEPGVKYSIRVGDIARGLLSEPIVFTINADGKTTLSNESGDNNFFDSLLKAYTIILFAIKSLFTLYEFLN